MADENERTPSSLLAGRYSLGATFASGGMGTVHLGRIVGASGFSRVVAIKRLFPGFGADRSFRQMLLDEARFASRIRHPNVVPILDVVEADRDLYVVMEYLHGLSLAEVFAQQRREPIPVEVAVAIADAVLRGLHAAHDARGEDGTPLGIVHRDVSPANVLVGADGVPRLIDFGIAKAATRVQVTDPGVLKGKAGYMAPEQLMHEPVTRQADVFSASVVLWEMLAGRRLFPFDMSERVQRIHEPPVPPSRHRAGIDIALDAVVLRGLERQPARRFPTAEAMASELRHERAVPSAVDVARWLADVGGDDLELSEERVRLFERSFPLRTRDSSNPSLDASVASVTTPVSTAAVAHGPRRARRAWLAGLGALLATFTGLLAVELVPRRGGTPVAPVAEPIVAASTASAPPAVSTPSASAALAGSSAPSASSAPASKPASSPTQRAARSKCDPPYTVDSSGFKHYDQRCF